jgi:hypothetical protein
MNGYLGVMFRYPIDAIRPYQRCEWSGGYDSDSISKSRKFSHARAHTIHLDRDTLFPLRCLSTSISHISMPFLLTVDESREN